MARLLLLVLALGSPAEPKAEPKAEASKAEASKAEAFNASNPHERALFVVDARVRDKTLLSWSEVDVQMGGLGDSASFEAPDPSPRHIAKAQGGVLVFAVEPGRYRPLYVRTRGPRLQPGTGMVEVSIPLPVDSMATLERRVAAGDLVYLGRLEVQTLPRPLKEDQYRFTLSYDAGRERQVWRELLGRKPGAWQEPIRARVAALAEASRRPAANPFAEPDSAR